ncbi:hypothetical protein [Pacificispira sp.]|uniref:hypothetical protein n=1 Tax=Pacificispira sp. TaxID=2888761 RepID=UPI003B516053
MKVADLLATIGTEAGHLILTVANVIVADFWPGLISFLFVAAAAMVALFIAYRSHAYISTYRKAIAAVQVTGIRAGHLDLAGIQERLNAQKGGPASKLANAFKEFCETLIVTGSGDKAEVRNAIRPSAFLNAEELGFSLKFYRFYPGLFVSLGLFLTFLGLVAVLSSTSSILPHEKIPDQAATMEALRVLLGKASAKFTISLTGLLCSIVVNFWLKFRAHQIEHHADILTIELEKNMEFISLEGLAERQLRAIEDQTADMKELNTRLIAAISEPLNRVADSSVENVGNMVKELGDGLATGLGASLDTVSAKIDAASAALDTIGSSLHSAAQQFDVSLTTSTQALDESVKRLEQVSEQLSSAGKVVGEATPSLLETIKETNTHSLKVAEGSVTMVNAAKTTISEEKETVTEAMAAIRDLIRSFESRAAAYDGQLKEAFQSYQVEVAKTIDRLETHGVGVQQRFTDALGILQAVIENAKAFEPESTANEVDPNETDETGEADA